jgi:hypothetical protein
MQGEGRNGVNRTPLSFAAVLVTGSLTCVWFCPAEGQRVVFGDHPGEEHLPYCRVVLFEGE